MRWLAVLPLPVLLLAQFDPDAARKLFDRGVEFAKVEQSEAAEREYAAAVERDPKFAEAWHALGRLQARRGRYDAARASFEAAIRARPSYLDAYAPLAVLQHDAHDWRGLLDTTTRLLRFEPDSPALLWLLHATANFNLNNLPEAENSAREAERLDPDHAYPQIRKLLGEIRRIGLPAAPRSAADFRANSHLALVRFQVTPRKGEFVTDLRPESIELREDGAPQKIAVFEGGEFHVRKTPLEITLLFDCSGSVVEAGALEPRVFEESLLREFENVSLAIYGFSDNLVRLATPTRDAQRLARAVKEVRAVPVGGTALFRSIAQVARMAGEAPRPAVRILVVFSDGAATAQRDADRAFEAAQAAREQGISIYPVLVAGAANIHAANSIHDFMQLAAETGGLEFQEVATTDVLPRILGRLAAHIRYDYVAGYYPSTLDRGTRHKVAVVWAGKGSGRIVGGTRITIH